MITVYIIYGVLFVVMIGTTIINVITISRSIRNIRKYNNAYELLIQERFKSDGLIKIIWSDDSVTFVDKDVN